MTSKSFITVAPKNASSNRNDISWKHCNFVTGDTRKLQFKYCQKVVTRGVYRLKHHLTGIQKDVEA